MKTFSCTCGARIFFDSVSCLGCGSEVGWCPACRRIAPIQATEADLYRCGNPDCGSALRKCVNYTVESVCNRMLAADATASNAGWCDCCRYNVVIPDLSVPGHRERWADLEASKRRLFYTLDLLDLPRGTEADGFSVPLSFAFMTDALPDQGYWRDVGPDRVYTGHQGGRITINVREADAVERERIRANLNEPHRSLIGHFRHEIGHYYWELLVKDRHVAAFRGVFGDFENPSYAAALDHHYQWGPPADWPSQYLSEYAAMHPWEDFAECFAFYLATVALVDTAQHWGWVRPDLSLDDLEALLSTCREVGIAVNELNRERGLKDLVPEVVTAPIRRKLAFVHRLIASQPRSATGG